MDLGAFSCLGRGELAGGDRGGADDLAVDDPHPVLTDGAHGQLGLERHPELADDDDVQRRAEGAGDLEGDRDTPPRQAKDHDTPIAQVLQPGGQAPSRIGPIRENHGYLLSRPTFSCRGPRFPGCASVTRDHRHLRQTPRLVPPGSSFLLLPQARTPRPVRSPTARAGMTFAMSRSAVRLCARRDGRSILEV